MSEGSGALWEERDNLEIKQREEGAVEGWSREAVSLRGGSTDAFRVIVS